MGHGAFGHGFRGHHLGRNFGYGGLYAWGGDWWPGYYDYDYGYCGWPYYSNYDSCYSYGW